MARKALLITPDLCIGCRACQVACKSWNELPAEKTKNNGTHENPPDLTGYTYNRIRFIEKVEGTGEIKWLFVSQRCMHCGEAACVEICPVKALKKDQDTGIVYYNKNQCIGCFACQAACPFNIPRYDKNNKIAKCHFCIDRVKAGLVPACAKTCPTESIRYGNREDLLKKARAEGYSVLYGEKELGGLGVIFALKDSPKEYQLVENPQKPENLIAMAQVLKVLIEKGVPISSSVLRDIGLMKV